MSSSVRKYEVNEEISAERVRLIDSTGAQLGIVDRRTALQTAAKKSLDLVMLSNESKPPVCKLMDYGRYVFAQKKARSDAAAKVRKSQTIKEVKLRLGTGDGDYQTKLKQMRHFLEDGSRTKVTLRFKGREIVYQNQGLALMRRVAEDLTDSGAVEEWPALEGRQMTMRLRPVRKPNVGKSGSEPATEQVVAEES